MKKEVSLLKLNTDPDVSDLGIISYVVVVEGNNEDDMVTDAKNAINGLDNEMVFEDHRVEELDCHENIAVREIVDVADETSCGLKEYCYRTNRENNIVFKVINLN